MQCLHFQARQAIHLGRSLRQVLALAHLSHDPLLGEKHMSNKIPTPEAGAKWPLYSVLLTADAAMGTAAVDDVAGFRSSAVSDAGLCGLWAAGRSAGWGVAGALGTETAGSGFWGVVCTCRQVLLLFLQMLSTFQSSFTSHLPLRLGY